MGAVRAAPKISFGKIIKLEIGGGGGRGEWAGVWDG